MMCDPAPVHFLEFEESGHRYFVDGEQKLSVTQILKVAGLVDDTWFTEFGRWRGSAVHKACQYLDEGDMDRRTLDPIVKPFVKDWKEFRERTGFTCIEIEKKGYDSTYEYCGMWDRFGYFKNEKPENANVLIDLKTYPSGQIPFWVRYQLAGYGRLKSAGMLYRRLAVVLTGNGANVIEYPVAEYASDVNKFLACSIVARVKQEQYMV